MVNKEGDEYHCTYRFRYYMDNRITNHEDRMNWYEFKTKDSRVIDMVLSTELGMNKDSIRIVRRDEHPNQDSFMKEILNSPGMHETGRHKIQ